MRKSNRKAPIVFYIGIILLCAWMASFHLVSGLYARYSTTTTASGSARVAKFSVSASADGNYNNGLNLDLSSATEAKSDHYSFTVANNSEVRVAYIVTVTLPSALPTGVTMTMVLNGSTEMTPTVSGNVYTYSSTLNFEETHNYTLTFTGDPAIAVAAELTGITIGVATEQID